MRATKMKHISSGVTAVALALALLSASTGLKADGDLYIDRPMPSYGPGAVETDPPLPEPGEWPEPEIAWEECAAPDFEGVQECFIAFANGGEQYYYIWQGRKYFHPPVIGMPSVPIDY